MLTPAGPTTRSSTGRLLGDLGATFARLAWQDQAGAALRAVAIYATREFPTPLALIRRYLGEHDLPLPDAVCLGVASALDGDEIRFINSDWVFSLRALGVALGTPRVWAINDFAAVANAIPSLTERGRLQTGGGPPDLSRPIGVVGAGTGLGMAALVPAGAHRWIVVPSEGGHATFSASTEQEWRWLGPLRALHGHVSVERVLSGAGLAALAQAIALEQGRTLSAQGPAEVVEAALDGSDECCVEAVRAFAAILGSVCGNLALTLGARGGIYVGGGMVTRLRNQFDWTRFRQGFEGKGRLADFLRSVPSYLITAEEPGLIGAAAVLDERLRGAAT